MVTRLARGALAWAIASAVSIAACGGSGAGSPALGDAGTTGADGATQSDGGAPIDAGADFGKPCSAHAQCASDICLPVGRCSKPCDGRSDCPPAPEWQCTPSPMGGGRAYCACTPSGPEVCDGRDNDCDTIVDGPSATCPVVGNLCENAQCVCPPVNQCAGGCVDTTRDRTNCGSCGTQCAAVCVGSACRGVVGACASDSMTCVRTSDQAVRCFGDNMYGEIGDGTTVPRMTPTLNLAGPADLIACGGALACARRGDGSVRCWGSPTVGNGSIGISVTPVEIPALAGARGISIGSQHACAVRADGTVVCWGSNADLELGVATTDSCLAGVRSYDCSKTPVVAGVADVASVASGNGFTCVLHTNADVECWGSASRGSLGDRSTTARGPNGTAIVHGARQVAAGDASACVLMNDGTVRCWGEGTYGQLGYAPSGGACGTVCSDTPAEVTGLAGVVELAMNGAHVCARMGDGTVRCWGRDVDGECGVVANGTCSSAGCVASPTAVPGVTGVVGLALGGRTSFAIRADGSILGWGTDLAGVLGDGKTTARATPAPPSW